MQNYNILKQALSNSLRHFPRKISLEKYNVQLLLKVTLALTLSRCNLSMESTLFDLYDNHYFRYCLKCDCLL
jgi:hypothetical protein